jgi:hypothetical protein
MTPSYEELLEGATTWRKSHNDVTYILSHHGHRISETGSYWEQHPGTWCYYLLIPEQMYPHRWADFACVRGDHGFESNGPAFDGITFSGGITFSESQPYFDRKAARMFDLSKVGCDYNHSWQHDAGFPDTYKSVDADATRTVEEFLEKNPDRHFRCGYSGLWDAPDRFYESVGGWRVHVDANVSANMTNWLPPALALVGGRDNG